MSSRWIRNWLLWTSVFVTALQASETRLALYETVEPHMGTLFRIKLYAGDTAAAQSASAAAFARVAELDDRLSDYKPDSELNVVVKTAVSHPVAISDDLATVLEASLKLAAATGGAFDITVGPLSRLWRAARKSNQLPSSESIQKELEKCGYRKLHLNAQARTIQLDRDDMQLDLGAIAKGYAADQALSVITSHGIRSALVAASGDLAFSDPPPGEDGWRVGIDSYDQADKPFTRVLKLSNAAVSTSGGTEQFLAVGGHRFSHIIDPKTGMGLERNIAVTTVSRHGITADPAATSVSVLGAQKGLEFVEAQPDVAAYILEQKDGRPVISESSRFETLEQVFSAKDGNGDH